MEYRRIAMKKIIISIVGLVFVSLVSCTDDWVDIEPVENATQESFYKTERDMNMAVIAAYDPLQWNATNYFSFEYHNFGMLAGVLSDDQWSGGGGASDRVGYLAAERGAAQPGAQDFYAMYRVNWSGVYRANMVISRMETVEEITNEARDQYLGEAKFLRALYYFRLVRMWGNLPLVDREMTKDELEALPQVEPSEIYNLIASDLYEASQILPASYESSQLGRATKWAASSLLLRVYLYFDGYIGGSLMANGTAIDQAKAAQIADSVILSSGHALLPDMNELFKSGNENNIESIFEVQYTDAALWGDWTNMAGQTGNMLCNFYGMRGVSPDDPYDDGWSYGTVTQELLDSYEANDPRKQFAVIDAVKEAIPHATDSYHCTSLFIKKYTPLKADRPASGGEKRFNYKLNEVIIRYADVLLMAAEINLGLNDGKALGYLNEVRTRAMGADEALDAIDLDAIYYERRAELAGEGHRYWDLLRRGLDYAETMINGTTVDGSDEYVSTFNMASKGLMPIPQNELDLMKSANWVQNSGY